MEQAQSTTLPALDTIGLSAYSVTYLCGMAGAGTPRANNAPYDIFALIDLAAAQGLGGVSFPPRWAMAGSPLTSAAIERIRDYATARGLFLVADTGVVNAADLRELLPVARDLGCRALRATLSTILCGDRRAVATTWKEYLASLAAILRDVRDLAAECGVPIGLENHQDVTSEELVWLCETVDSPWVGVTLDAVNPLAVAEDILAFAQRVGPYIKNVHLKDYRIYATPQGYRLVRSPIGSGILDVSGLFAFLRQTAPQASVSIELAALEARHVKFLDDDFWPGYPVRRIEDVLPVLRLRERKKRPAGEDWRTPWERGSQGDVLADYELDQVIQSVMYLDGRDRRSAL